MDDMLKDLRERSREEFKEATRKSGVVRVRKADSLGREAYLTKLFDRADRSGGPDSCWVIHSCKSRYPVARIGSYKGPITRIVWTLLRGPIPDGWVIRHKCDNPRCINPAHLEAGTQSQNIVEIARMFPKGKRLSFKERRAAATKEYLEYKKSQG